MNKVPDKCVNCERAVAAFENVHKGFCKFEYEVVIRCNNKYNKLKYPVGCVSAEVYCDKKGI